MSAKTGMSKAHQHQNTRRPSKYGPYKMAQRREHNKALRLLKHLDKHPWEQSAYKAFIALPFTVRARYQEPKLGMSPVQDRARLGVTLTHERKMHYLARHS